jgi:hypothetical protein
MRRSRICDWQRPRTRGLGSALLAAALLLVFPTPGGADEEPRADPAVPEREVLRFFRMLEQGVQEIPRPAARRPEAWLIAEFTHGATRFEAVLDGKESDVHPAVVAAMCARGWRFERVVAWEAQAPTPGERDAAALVAGDGRLPEGYVPAGKEAPGEIPPLSFLGGTVVLEIVAGEARARVTAAPEGSRARKIGLGEGDVILEVDGETPGPRNLASLAEEGAPAAQHRLWVRRTHGGIERIVVDSWARRLPAR